MSVFRDSVLAADVRKLEREQHDGDVRRGCDLIDAAIETRYNLAHGDLASPDV